KGIREVDESLLVSPDEFKPPLILVRQDLSSMDDELLVMLFPRRPGEKKSEAPAAPLTPPPAGGPRVKAEDKIELKTEEGVDGKGDGTPADAIEEKSVEKSEMPDMNIKNCIITVALTCSLGSNCAGAPSPQQKDYLSSLESDKIRDAETTNERIKLFLT